MTRSLLLKIILLAFSGLVVVAFALIGFLYITRGTPLRAVTAFGDPAGPPSVGDPQFRRTMELHTGVVMLEGNKVRVAINGDQTYPQLWADLRSARRSITLQMYYCKPGRMATELKDILVDRAGAGVRVLFLLDAFGAQDLSKAYLDSLEVAGVRVSKFRPLHWYSFDKFSHRSHIRVVVVDGSVGWTGGFGIDDKWFGDGRHDDQWRDTNARFEGPAVMQHQATFAAGWAEATGELLTGDLFFPPSGFRPDGQVYAALLHLAPTTGSTPAERFLALTITAARRTLYVSNSYFVPDDDFRRLLVAAAKRGVDVRILTTSDKTDVPTTWYAGRRRYEELLRGGVRVFEYQPVMMHAKTIVADGLWASVGTMNFDNRSLVFNDETNLVALDAALGAELETIFLEDLRYAREIDLETFRRRSAWERVKENGAHLLSRLL
ncbi:MAG TPA: phospholipase D-like domain-containing protein [Gemmatimonadaceae bacterium]|nr:phospholipase D-like domain-containing protein [Gemmatimonadaceae bacterium]